MRTGWRQGLIGTMSLVCSAMAMTSAHGGDGSGTNNERLLPGLYPEAPVLDDSYWLREPYDPFFDVDWSVALRGSYTKSTTQERFDTLLLPTLNLEHIGTRSAVAVDGDAEIVREENGTLTVTGLRLGLDAGYALDQATRATATADLNLSQPLPGTPGIASNIAVAPQAVAGDASLGVTREFGRFNVGVTGAIRRELYGDTIQSGGAVVSNADQNLWSFDGTLRVGLQATPIFEVFGEAIVGRDSFDQPSPSLGVSTDASTRTLLAGVTGRWNGVLEATAATGVTLRRFDAPSLGEVEAQVYNASVSFNPDSTLRLRAGLNTRVGAPGPSNPGTARVEYIADFGADYTVNSWLALRAQAAWNTATFVGSPATETGYRIGGGADYSINEHLAVGADYSYSQATTTADGLQEAHRISLGITVRR